MNEIVYNSIGTDYNINRAADNRISNIINDLLDLPAGSVIADIGAGTGNYSNALADLGYRVKAVEPSEKMRSQAKPNPNVTWFSGSAESIPLPDDSVNGIVVILAIHHFSSLKSATYEMHRICPSGPILVFTLDPREGKEPWFKEYFPEIYQQDFTSFQPINIVSEMIALDNGWSKTIEKFPLPHDLSDKNMYSAWREPEIYLDAQFRQNTSGFALAPESVVQNGIDNLKKDLHTGKWDKKYGDIREQEYFDAGFRFIKCMSL
jgi:ubiquinone/menaquinone biosynthesis C-methylase UbiE